MKRKSKNLDVDFIGGQGPLTKEEEKAISDFIEKRNVMKNKRQTRKTKTSSRKKIIV